MSPDDVCIHHRLSLAAPTYLPTYLPTGGSKDKVKGDLIAVVTGTLPPSPAGLYASSYVAEARKYNARYLSLSAYDLSLPGR